jgi:valine dehydrogenase (NAD+)
MLTVRELARESAAAGAEVKDTGVKDAGGKNAEVEDDDRNLSQASHEQVVFCHDAPSGLRAIIAIYSTALGPALGGTRIYPYPSHEAAIADVLNLSKAMAYKNALADLDYGGGKAVIIGDPGQIKTEALLRAFGRFVQTLNGRYVTACDVGTDCKDMDTIARETQHVAGRSESHGGAGDPSPLTALGVLHAMRASAQHAWDSPELEGRVVALEGVGKVGSHLVDHLVAAGARVIVYDVSDSAVAGVLARHPAVTAAASRAGLISAAADIYAPCALGGAIDETTVSALRATVICGCANNQLAHPGMDELLAAHGILYAPDYVVNAGGVIQVADELAGFNFERAKSKAERIFDTTSEILALSRQESVPPAVAADRLAKRRMSEVGRLRGIWLGS